MVTNRDQVLLFLNAQYNLIDNNYEALFRRCTSDAEQQLLSDLHQEALGNLVDAENLVFDSNADAVQQLLDTGRLTLASIEASIKTVAAIANILNAITAVVQIGTSLVALGTPK